MTPAQRADLIERAQQAHLVAQFDDGQLHLWPERPVDPDAPPYYSSDDAARCYAFLTGWSMHAYDDALRRLAHIRQGTA